MWVISLQPKQIYPTINIFGLKGTNAVKEKTAADYVSAWQIQICEYRTLSVCIWNQNAAE